MRKLHPAALYAALDAERRRHGVTWQQVAHESGVSAQTNSAHQGPGAVEVDGILALTGWLGRPTEEFTVEDGIGLPVKREELR